MLAAMKKREDEQEKAIAEKLKKAVLCRQQNDFLRKREIIFFECVTVDHCSMRFMLVEFILN